MSTISSYSTSRERQARKNFIACRCEEESLALFAKLPDEAISPFSTREEIASLPENSEEHAIFGGSQ